MAAFLRTLYFSVVFILAFTVIAPAFVFAEGENGSSGYEWIEGAGQTVTMADIAELKLDPELVYLDAENTRRYLDENGEISSESDIGSVYPKNADWAVFFEYSEDGHISDEEKDKIDADALLESYKKGTEERNAKLDNPADHLFVDGWEKPPAYNEGKHALTWALRAHDNANQPIINSNVRILTRVGYLSVVLVTDPAHLNEDSASMEKLVLSTFSTKAGQRYEDFDAKSDKKAKYGLTGLILGGAGLAVAKKAGLLALLAVGLKKFWFLIVAAGAPLWKFLKGRRGQKLTAAKEPRDWERSSQAFAESDKRQAEAHEEIAAAAAEEEPKKAE
ncbi:DUF2167 domain-containing protein [Cohnella pontilimi]|uniref:DUF2167 domain-containing protein n=1 Tax=Cohnella pontilimi TaxID=2564100 RepID=A0A4U0FG32_9BACL|nr:DUF2167 domain-containing protein [Cohnella pontilimi]TJY43344.1 DUF2167 domain-containing protein [Cohnella pontilimi]